jgi:hypothetical protein
MEWLSGGLAVACLVVGLLHLVRLAVRRRDAAVELSHAAMGLGMAAMFSPLGDPLPRPLWTAVFVLCAAWFAAAVLRSGSLAGDGPHHVVGSGAMLFMLAAGHAAPGDAASAHAGHAAHGGAAGTLGLASVAALVLAAYFAWHALRCADRCRRPDPADGPAPPPGGAVALAWSPAAPRIAVGAHLVMSVAMVVMLLGMV